MAGSRLPVPVLSWRTPVSVYHAGWIACTGRQEAVPTSQVLQHRSAARRWATPKGELWAFTFLLLALALVTGCSPSEPPRSQPVGGGRSELTGKTVVFHAGSLAVPMQALTRAFQDRHPGVTFETEAAGSRTTARKVSELGRLGDVVMSADYTVIDNLLIPGFASWNIQFARNAMVIAYTDRSRFAQEINSENWHDVLTREGVIYGHSDPNVDPCGYRSLMVWQLAEAHYGIPGLNDRLLRHRPPENVRPKEVDLIALLQSGDMDYAFQYRSIAVQHGLEFVELPAEINLSAVEYVGWYAQAEVEVSGTEPGTTITQVGTPIVYGVTIPANAPSPELALEFVAFLIGPEGQAIVEGHGQSPIVPPVAIGRTLPPALRSLVQDETG